MTQTTPSSVDAIDWSKVRDGDTLAPDLMDASAREWLVQQLVHWPRRVNPDFTTNDSFLRTSAARLIEWQAAEIARLSTLPSDGVTIPAGWVLVPRQPTEEMLAAAPLMDGDTIYRGPIGDDAAETWRLMIAAAPKAPPVAQAEDFTATVRVSQDGQSVTVEHKFDADWETVLRVHEALRDWAIQRIAGHDECPYRPADAREPTDAPGAPPAPQGAPTVDEAIARIPSDAFWQIGHDGEGPDPSLFKARIFDPQTMTHPIVARAATPHEALRAAFAALSATTEQGEGE